MPASPLNKEPITEDSGFKYKHRCRTPLDGEKSFIGFQLRDFGYTTMMAEDWALGVFNHPNCAGFTTTPVDHYMRPLQLRHGRMTLTAPKNYRDFVNYEKRRCREGHQILLDYLESFINIYDDVRQKFSITWATQLAHENLNHIYHGDGSLYEVFEKLKSNMDDAFLIVMSEHGIRIGDHLNTEIGELEGYNPAFFIAVPRKLRTNKNSHLWNESHWDSRQWPTDDSDCQVNVHMYGSSLLRTLKQPRDCSSLRIPYAYCLCAKPYTEVTNDMALVVRLAQASVDKINENIRAHNLLDKCADLSLNESGKITLLETREQVSTLYSDQQKN
ncbi:hypothetical protein Ddc_00392 [Ditylenchus destructor]|nr:hypothetical protein Ddc_00392 [Ditylenchus destructor]